MRKPVVIVGGGIFGVCVLDALTRRGIPAHLVEQGELGSGATGHSGGMLRRWHASQEMVDLASASMPFWEELGYHRTGSLYFELRHAVKPELPPQAEWLTGAEGAERFPQLTWHDEDRAIYEADGGWADPQETLRKLAERARAGGGRVSVGRRVLAGDAGPTGVSVTLDGDERLEAEAVVWAMGPHVHPTRFGPPECDNRLIQVIALEGQAPGVPCFLDRVSRGFLRNAGERVWIGVGLDQRATSTFPADLEATDVQKAREAVAYRLPAALSWPQVGGVRTADLYLPSRVPYFGPARYPTCAPPASGRIASLPSTGSRGRQRRSSCRASPRRQPARPWPSTMVPWRSASLRPSWKTSASAAPSRPSRST